MVPVTAPRREIFNHLSGGMPYITRESYAKKLYKSGVAPGMVVTPREACGCIRV